METEMVFKLQFHRTEVPNFFCGLTDMSMYIDSVH